MSARSEILALVRSAKGAMPARGPRTYSRVGDLTGDALIALFVERVVDYKAQVHQCRRDEVAGVIDRALAAAGAVTAVVPVGLALDLRPSTAEVDPGGHGRELERFDAVVTTALIAIADTGTFVLDHADPSQGRRALSLVPDVHVCVLMTDQIVQTVPEGVAGCDPRHHLTWVSGPSATSDIELNRVEGVHGPRTLVVVLVR